MFWEMKLSSPKYCFYALNKIPLRETGCLSSLYYLLATQESIFLIHSFFGTHSVSKRLVPCHSLCSNCVTYGMLCHAIGHQICPTKTFLEKQKISLGVAGILKMCLCPHSYLTCNQFNE